MPNFKSVHTSPKNKSEYHFEQLIHDRKKLGLTYSDLTLLMYFVFMSRRRFIVKTTSGELSERLNIRLPTIHESIRKLKTKQYIGVYKSKNFSGYIVDPRIINNGSFKKQGYKVKIWNEMLLEETPFMSYQKSHSCKD